MMHRNPVPTVDVIIVDDEKVLLVKRGRDPYAGCWALPGGFIEYGECVEDAAVREVQEETGVKVRVTALLGVYSSPDRDPRHHTMTSVFVAELLEGRPVGGDDAAEAAWHPLDSIESLRIAFDHSLILRDFVKWQNDGGTYWSSKVREA